MSVVVEGRTFVGVTPRLLPLDRLCVVSNVPETNTSLTVVETDTSVLTVPYAPEVACVMTDPAVIVIVSLNISCTSSYFSDIISPAKTSSAGIFSNMNNR